MYLINLVKFDSMENEIGNAVYSTTIGVIDGDKACAEQWMKDNSNLAEPKYTGWDGVEYPYFEIKFVKGLNKEQEEVNELITKQKVFISQPMNGKTVEEIRKEREIAIEELMNNFPNEEFQVIDTILPDAGLEPESRNRIFMLGRSIELLADADLVYLSKGWQDSNGCMVEYEIAKRYNIKMVMSEFNPHKTAVGKRLDAGLWD